MLTTKITGDQLKRETSQKPRYAQVVEQIQHSIKSGELGPGDQLLPERELGETLGVSRTSVRQALGILEGMGIIKVTPRNGAYVRQPNFADAIESLAQALYFERDQVTHLFEVRQIIETQTAVLAAQRRNEDDIRRLRKLNRQYETDLQRGDLAFEANKNFHIGLVETAKNPLLIGITTTILVATMEVYVSARHQSLSEKRDLSLFVAEHEQIIEAIAQQDPALTGQLVTNHINAARTRVEIIMEQQ